jgi:hypothetical protein
MQLFRIHRGGLTEHGERGTVSQDVCALLGTASHDLAAHSRLAAACAALTEKDVHGVADRVCKS